MIDIATVESELRKLGVVLDTSSVRLHSEQGKVNEVYTADSDAGRLIIHVGKKADRDVQVAKAQRVFELSKFLEGRPKIPTAKVILQGIDSYGVPFIVQEYIEGVPLREAEDQIKHLQELGRIVAYMHQIDVRQAGNLEFKGELQGNHKDWLTFLMTESYECLDRIYAAELISKEKYRELETKLAHFFTRYEQYFKNVRGKLLHGDVSLNNVIINNEQVAALVDLEWSAAGDPAWEFAMGKPLPEACLLSYFDELRKLGLAVDEENFRFRIKLYRAIKFLFISNTNKKGDEQGFAWAMKHFEAAMDELT